MLCSGYDGQCFRAAGVMYQSDSVGGTYMDAGYRPCIELLCAQHVPSGTLSTFTTPSLEELFPVLYSRRCNWNWASKARLYWALYIFQSMCCVEYSGVPQGRAASLSPPFHAETTDDLLRITSPLPNHHLHRHSPPPSIHTSEALQILSNHILRSFLSCILIAPCCHHRPKRDDDWYNTY